MLSKLKEAKIKHGRGAHLKMDKLVTPEGTSSVNDQGVLVFCEIDNECPEQREPRKSEPRVV